MTRTLTVIALCIALAGAMIIAGPTFGFSTLAADRGVNIGTAGDSTNAYLGVDNETDVGELRSDNGPIRVATLFNNLNEDVSVIDFNIYNDGGTLAIANPNPGETIPNGGSTDVEIECAASDSIGQRTIDIEVAEVDGPTTSIEGVTFSVGVDIQCGKGGGSGAVSFQADDVNETDTTQTFSFDASGLGNKDQAYIDLSDPQQNGGVDYSNGNAEIVTGSGTVTYEEQNDRIVYTADKNVKGTVEIRMNNINVVGSSGDYYTTGYSEDRKNENNRDDSDVFFIND